MKSPRGVHNSALILGCGFTGRRVAERLRQRGFSIRCPDRAQLDFCSSGWRRILRPLMAPLILHSLPPLPDGIDEALVEEFEARRVIYLSSTSVYGSTREVNERTVPISGGARISVERAIQAGPWSSLILRPAAIYGPGRGIHMSMKARTFRLLGDGSNFVSRIHVDDLAAIAEAALLSGITGAYPVADRHPCPSREIAEFCSRLLGLPIPPSASREELPSSRRADRRVDGSAICKELGIELRYPSYTTGIPASLAEPSGSV